MTYKLTNTSQPADPYYGAVSLLLDGTDLQDKSLDTKAITVNGDAQVSTAQSKWNGSSLYFDGTGDSLYIADADAFSFGTGDFTVECWLYQSTFNTDTIIDFRGSSTYGFVVYSDVLTNGQARVYNQAVFKGQSTIAFNTNSWNHFALVRSGGTVTAYINGQNGLSYSDTSNFQIASARIGNNTLLSQGLNGYLQDIRITKGVARYTANFTPPTQPFFGALNPDQDRYFYATTLLLHGDGTNGSTTIVDSSDESNTITAAGNGQISTAQNKFGGSSLAFNLGYFTTPYSLDLFDWWTAPHTIEAWVYASSFASTDLSFRPLMVGNMDPSTGTNYWSFGVNRDARVYFFWWTGATNNVYSATNVVSLNTWTHIAMTHESGTVRLFADGALVASTSSLGNPQSSSGTPLSIGAWNNTSMDNIYVDDLRITKGAARYTSTFTRPTKAFPNY